MKNSTIWESASRPLFVRTVWLEGSELRRGLQRHFLLDYDTKRPLERLNSAGRPSQGDDTDTLKRSISWDLNDFPDFANFNEADDEVFVIGSAKVKLHEPYKLATNKKSKILKYRRRTSLFSRKYPSYDNCNFVSKKDIPELYSRSDSLTDTSTIAVNADELLAERVLHWLDLAGKEDLRNLQELKDMEVKLSKTCKLRQDAIKRYNSKNQNTQKSKPAKIKNCQQVTQTSSQRNNKTSEAVNHITIIFNKEGQPIRLNRPAKNIDICALSTSPSTTRRLAGTLASARLYKSADHPRYLNVPQPPYMKNKPATDCCKAFSARRRLDTVADLSNSTLQKRLHEKPLQGAHNNSQDSRKQLHIFMPTLPKKGLNKSVYGNEDGISELSNNFSELCRM